jgi:hypothetical protein
VVDPNFMQKFWWGATVRAVTGIDTVSRYGTLSTVVVVG